MHALSRIHRALLPGGTLVDLHPVPPPAVVASTSGELGVLDSTEFETTVARAEAGLATAVERGLFRLEAERRFPYTERFEDAKDLLEDVSGWDGTRIPEKLARAVEASSGPLTITQPAVIRRFAALEP